MGIGFEGYDTISHALGGETNAQYAANSIINGLAMAADTSDGESGYVEVAANLAMRKAAQVAVVDAAGHVLTAAANGKGGKGSSSSSGSSPEGSSTETAPSKPANAEPVKPGDKGNYGDLKDQKAANGETEPLQMDHQPSFAAQVKAKETELGRKLSPQELKDLKNNTPAVASPTEVHQQTSPTYGGRNTAAQSDADAKDLQGAAARDKAAFDKAMSQRQSQQQQNQQPPSK